MASNKELILQKYGNGQKEERRATSSRTDYLMQFHYTKKIVNDYITTESHVAEIGCGTGYYGIYLADKCKEYYGIDIVPGNIEIFNKKIKNANLNNVQADLGDATNLAALNDKCFDVVLVFGPMYHLPREERQLVFRESYRICKDNGIVLFAYTNKIGAYMRGCIREEHDNIYPNKQANISLFQKGTDDIQTGVFYYTMPEEMEYDANEQGFSIIRNVGVDFTFNVVSFDDMCKDQKEAWFELFDYMYDSPSCTGFSNHAVLVCRK